MNKYDVITVGSATIDNFIYTNIPELHKQKNSYIAYPSGSKFLVNEVDTKTGGSATNTATALSRLGLKVGCMSCVGNDENAKVIISELKKEKIDFIGIKTNKKTGYSIILDSKEHNRTILIYYGANSELDFKKINKTKLNTKWFYFGSLSGTSFKTQKKLIDFAKKKGIKVAYNPSQYSAKKGKELYSLLKKVDFLILNKEESELLLNKKEKIEKMLELLHKKGPVIVCITDGEKGAYLSDGKSKLRISTHPIKVVERTGAGDAFAASLLAGLIKIKNIETALKIALINSESVIKHKGAKNKLLTWKEVIKELKKVEVELK